MTHRSFDRRARLVAAGSLSVAALAGRTLAAPPARVVDVGAKKFEFVPPVIRVKQGETVMLRITAPEVPMGVNFADFKVRTDVIPGKTAEVTLTPGQAGTYTFVCDVFCGSGHDDMGGTLTVGA